MKHNIPHSRRGGCLFKLVKLFVLVAVVLGVALYFARGLVADYALKTLTSGTGIEAGISSVSVDVREQKVKVSDFFITNPPNFEKCNALAFKTVLIDADITAADALSKKLVVVDEVRIEGLSMNLEVKTEKGISGLISSPKSNLTEIKSIFENKFGLNGDKKNQTQTAQTAKSDSGEWKFIIRKIVFAQGTIDGSLNNRKLKITMPSFELTNLGVSQGGETVGELVSDITNQLAVIGTAALLQDAVKGGIEAGGDGANDALKGAGKAVENTLKNLFK